MSLLGIDIGTSHTKIVEILTEGSINRLAKFAIFPSNGLFEAMQDASYNQSKGAVNYLKKMLNEAHFGTNKVALTLPDFKIVTKVIEMPYIEGDKHIQQAIEYVADEHLPMPMSEMSVKFSVLKENLYNKKKIDPSGILPKAMGYGEEKKGTMEVLLVAAPKKLIDNYIFIAHKVGFEIIGLEPNSLTLSRCITSDQRSVPTMILNLGSNYTDIVLVTNGNVRFVRNVKFGVQTLTRKLVEDLNLSTTQAENYLFTYGLNPTQLNGKVKELLDPVMSVLIQEIVRFQEYVEQRIRFVPLGEPNKVRRMVVSGGGALIPNIILELIGQLSLEVQYSDPWKTANIDLIAEKDMLKIVAPIFTTSVGAVIK